MKSYSEVFINRLFCCLIVGIQARGISIPLSLLMLLGWSLIWIASLTLGVYQWGSRSINLTLLQIGICPVSLACSATAEVWVRVNRMSSSCSFILSRIDLPVSPIYTLPHFHGILWTTPSCFDGSRSSLGRTKWDLSVMSDLKTVRMPWCCRQRRRTSDTPREKGSRFRFLRGLFVGCCPCCLCEFSYKWRRIAIRNHCRSCFCFAGSKLWLHGRSTWIDS